MKFKTLVIAAVALLFVTASFGQNKKYKSKAPFTGYPEGYEAFAAQLDMIHQKTGSGFEKGNAIKWNFGKFLISKDGNTILRFEPMVSPEMLEEAIQEMLK